VFRRLDEVMKTRRHPRPRQLQRSISPDRGIHQAAARRDRHAFLQPGQRDEAAGVVRGEKTAKDVLATVMGMAKKIKKTAVVSGVCDGFIGNRWSSQYLVRALFLLEEGASPHRWTAQSRSGHGNGPLPDVRPRGQRHRLAIRKRRYREQPGMKYSRIADRLCEQGASARRRGSAGTATRPAGATRFPTRGRADDRRLQQGDRCRAAQDRRGRDRAAADLRAGQRRRCYPARRDRATRLRYRHGLPDRLRVSVYRGGPMFYADEIGLYNVVASMGRFAANPQGDPGFWKPAPLLDRLAAEGKRFN